MLLLIISLSDMITEILPYFGVTLHIECDVSGMNYLPFETILS